jgi:hypothetical protein
MLCKDVYERTSEKAEEVNNLGLAGPSKCEGRNSAIEAGKFEHTDDKVVRNVEVRSSNTENKKEADRQTQLQGRNEKTMRVSYDREGSGIRKDNCGLALDRIKVEIHLSRGEKCQLLQMSHFVKRPGKCKNFVYQFRMQGGLPKSCCYIPGS